MYEEEDDDLPHQYRRLTAGLQTGSADFNRRLAAYLTNQVAMRSALDQAITNSFAQAYPNAPQFAHNQTMYQSPLVTQPMAAALPMPYDQAMYHQPAPPPPQPPPPTPYPTPDTPTFMHHHGYPSPMVADAPQRPMVNPFQDANVEYNQQITMQQHQHQHQHQHMLPSPPAMDPLGMDPAPEGYTSPGPYAMQDPSGVDPPPSGVDASHENYASPYATLDSPGVDLP
ncbi:hypothetical protein GP486_008723, partial [Trichoglossum hirsutum]